MTEMNAVNGRRGGSLKRMGDRKAYEEREEQDGDDVDEGRAGCFLAVPEPPEVLQSRHGEQPGANKNAKSSDSALASTKDGESWLSSERKLQHILSFKEFKGFKKIENVKGRYKIGRVLGEGNFGQVRIALHRQAGIKCALKIIRKEKVHANRVLMELMHSELQVLEDTAHPNIVRIYELLHDDKFYFIVSELIRHGELFDHLIRRGEQGLGPLSEAEVRGAAKQLLYALNYMHSLSIAHRDIKPENILIESVEATGLQIKLTDFGFAHYFNQQEKLSEVLGSPLYMAPEIIK